MSTNTKKTMTWYYKVEKSHTYVSVFMNGGKCGDLCFRNEEFEELQERPISVAFVNDGVL